MNIVRLGAIAGFASLLKDLNGDLDKICQICELQPDMLDEAHYNNYLPLEHLARILDTAVQITNCHHFSLQLGMRKEASALGVLGILVKQSKTVREALVTLVENLHIHAQDAMICEFFTQDGLATLRLDQNLSAHKHNHQVSDLTNGCCISLMKSLCGSDFQFHEVRMTGRQRPSQELYKTMINGRVRFSQAHNELVFDAKYLDIKLTSADPQIAALLNNYLGQQSSSPRSLNKDTLAYLHKTLGTEDCCCGKAAEYFSLTRRTFNRKLADENTTFNLLLQQVKTSRAERMLSSENASITHTAFALGYADVSSFIKAFRGWHGISPKQWQLANKHQD